MENDRSLNVNCLNLAPIEKAWFLALMEYSPNGKRIMALMEYILMVYSSNGKGMALYNILFWSGNGHGKDKRKYNKNVDKN